MSLAKFEKSESCRDEDDGESKSRGDSVRGYGSYLGKRFGPKW